MTLWFHPACAAFKRPAAVLEALAQTATEVPEGAALDRTARASAAHRRLARIDGAERAPSGQAKCRQCRERIERGTWRIRLVFFEEAASSPEDPCISTAATPTSRAMMPSRRCFTSAGTWERRSWKNCAARAVGSRSRRPAHRSSSLRSSVTRFQKTHVLAGSGVARERVGLRLDANYHYLFASGENLEFFPVRAGIIFYPKQEVTEKE